VDDSGTPPEGEKEIQMGRKGGPRGGSGMYEYSDSERREHLLGSGGFTHSTLSGSSPFFPPIKSKYLIPVIYDETDTDLPVIGFSFYSFPLWIGCGSP
jgi:hypothetical protein